MRLMIIAAVAALAFASTADAKSCKDPKTGKFGACPAAAKAMPAMATPTKSAAARCKDAKGHFIMCGAPAAAPAIAAAPAKTSSMAAAPAKKSSMAVMKSAGPRAADKCKTGVPCGKSCIPKGKVCHKS